MGIVKAKQKREGGEKENVKDDGKNAVGELLVDSCAINSPDQMSILYT